MLKWSLIVGVNSVLKQKLFCMSQSTTDISQRLCQAIRSVVPINARLQNHLYLGFSCTTRFDRISSMLQRAKRFSPAGISVITVRGDKELSNSVECQRREYECGEKRL